MRTLNRKAARVKCLKQVADNGHFKKVKCPHYVEWSKDSIWHDSVKCKLCGVEIQALSTHPKFPDKLVPRLLPNYLEIEILTTRGAHVTPICRDCFRKGLSRLELNEILLADIAMLDFLEENGYGENGWEGFADREAVTYRRGRM